MKRAAFALVFLLASPTYAITPEQCAFFAEDGRTVICHATPSAKHPYVILRLSQEACVAHSEHPGDVVSLDGTCDGQGCLPDSAPCDATLPCCEGSACINGVCQPVAVCHNPEICLPGSVDCCEGYLCTSPEGGSCVPAS